MNGGRGTKEAGNEKSDRIGKRKRDISRHTVIEQRNFSVQNLCEFYLSCVLRKSTLI